MEDFDKFLWSLWKILTLNKKYVNNFIAKDVYYKLKHISIQCMMKIRHNMAEIVRQIVGR